MNIIEIGTAIIQYSPFYGYILLQMKKICNNKMPYAAGVGVTHSGQLLLMYNELMINKEKDQQQLAIIEHEIKHIAHGHLYFLERLNDKPRLAANIAMDCAINCTIDYLPEWTVHPSKFRDMGIEMVDNETCEYYYEKLKEASQKEWKCPDCKCTHKYNSFENTYDGSEESDGDGSSENQESKKSDEGNEPGENESKNQKSEGNESGKNESNKSGKQGKCSCSCHSAQEQVDQWMKDAGYNKNGIIERVMEKAGMKTSDHSSMKNVPRPIQEAVINEALDSVKIAGFDTSNYEDELSWMSRRSKILWKKLFQSSLMRMSMPSEDLQPTKSRFSKRYGSIPGIRREYTVGLVLVILDTSGSMSNEILQSALSEIEQLSHLFGKIKVIEFDTDFKLVQEWRKGQKTFKITGRGGTYISDEMIDLLNKEYKRWNKIVITDGYINNLDGAIQNIEGKLVWLVTDQNMYNEIDKKASYKNKVIYYDGIC